MSDDYSEGYADGFNAGWDAASEAFDSMILDLRIKFIEEEFADGAEVL